MTKKMMKITAAALAACMALPLAGCGKKRGEASVSFDENGNYVPSEELVITGWNTQGTDYTMPTEIEDNVVSDYLYDKTKVKFEYIYGNDGGQWDTKLSKLVAGDNMPHVVFCGAGQGATHFAKLDDIDMVWELTPELLQKYAPNVWKRVPEEYWDKMTINGKILGIPYVMKVSETTEPYMTDDERAFVKEYLEDVPSDYNPTLYIRDDIAKLLYPNAHSWDEICKLVEEKKEPIGEELLDIPIETTEDYINLLEKIKGLNLKADGKPVYAFGYTGGDNWVALGCLGGDMIGYSDHNYTSTWNFKMHRIEVPLAGEYVKEAAKIQNRLIRENVIDPESLVHTIEMFKEKVLSGQYAIAPVTYVSNIAKVNEMLKDAGKDFRYRPLMAHAKRIEGYDAFKTKDSWGSSLCMLKTMSEAEMIQFLNFVNVQFSDEFNEVFWWGRPEDGLYREENGKRYYTDERFTKRFVDGDSSALKDDEAKGIANSGNIPMLIFPGYTYAASKWNPVVVNKTVNLHAGDTRSFGFKVDSEHVTSVKDAPPCKTWAPEFAEIPEVVTFWANREQWEQPFKVAISQDSEEAFEAKWQEAIENLNSIADINAMADKMTEIAKKYE